MSGLAFPKEDGVTAKCTKVHEVWGYNKNSTANAVEDQILWNEKVWDR